MKNKYIKLLICFVIITLMFTGCNSKKENNEVTQNESIKIDKEEVIEEETDDKCDGCVCEDGDCVTDCSECDKN